MGQQFAAYRNTVYESAVVAFQVDQMEGGIGFADGEVTARYRAIAQAKIVGGIAADRKLSPGNLTTVPFEGPETTTTRESTPILPAR